MAEYNIYRPQTLSDAVNILAEQGDKAVLLAGGTDLIIKLKEEELVPKGIMDLSRISELKGIEENDTELIIGSLTTCRELCDSPLIRQYASVLTQAAGTVGSPQIRNRATIGGNVMNAGPAADLVPALVVLETKAKLVSAGGERWVSLEQLITGPYQTSRQPGEILTQLKFTKPSPDSVMMFHKVGRRNALAIARVNLAVLLQPLYTSEYDKPVIGTARICLGSICPVPFRSRAVEQLLEGKPVSKSLLKEAADQAETEFIELAGLRSSTVYKRPVVRGLTEQILIEAWEVIQGEQH